MIQPKLYYLMGNTEYSDEAFGTHAVSVDMDEDTARLILSKEFEIDEDDIEVLEYATATVDGWDITLTEKKGK